MIDKETAIENILNNFNFEKVMQAMKCLDWKYWDSDEYPTLNRLYKSSKGYLEKAFDESVNNKKDCVVGSGGFIAEATYSEEHKCVDYLNLYFQVTNWDFYQEE